VAPSPPATEETVAVCREIESRQGLCRVVVCLKKRNFLLLAEWSHENQRIACRQVKPSVKTNPLQFFALTLPKETFFTRHMYIRATYVDHRNLRTGSRVHLCMQDDKISRKIMVLDPADMARLTPLIYIYKTV
jgi:hypothetical protein